MITADELRGKYLEFFKSKGHAIIPSASLIPEKDESANQETLFITAGMQPLIPYLLGKKHPAGDRLVDVQKCIRTKDIDEVGDNRHLTFFEMLGNWSLGSYFKEDAINWSFEFLTDKKEGLGLDPNRLYVTVFKGEDGIPRDEISIEIWKKIFLDKARIKAEVAGEDEIIKDNIRIIPLGKDDNFWIAGDAGPCGGDTEMFYDVNPEIGKLNGKFSDLVDTFRIIEIWNDVFMEFNKTEDGKYQKLEKPIVDTGMGLERTLKVVNNFDDIFQTDVLEPIIGKIEKMVSSVSIKKLDKLSGDDEYIVPPFDKPSVIAKRIIADHIKAAVFIINDGAIPSKKGRGYVARRLIRRAIVKAHKLGIKYNFTADLAESIFEIYKNIYDFNIITIKEDLENEESSFRSRLEKGLRELYKIIKKYDQNIKPAVRWPPKDIKKVSAYTINAITPKEAFNLYQTYGFPLELINEELAQFALFIDEKEFNEEFKKHQELSRTASAGMFKGGLADSGEMSIKYHTATHLLLAALREILGSDLPAGQAGIYQKGSNITAERLRFDFNYPQKLTEEQIKKVEDLVNEKIQEKIPVEMIEMPKTEALKIAKVSFDPAKYGDVVKVYKIGNFSIELCGGPHVKNTGELGHFKIQKEESSSAGVRRIKAVLE
jgi:alanyl-tRNA synthetase